MSLESSGDRYIFLCFVCFVFCDCFYPIAHAKSQAGNLCILQTQKYINRHRTTSDDSNPFHDHSQARNVFTQMVVKIDRTQNLEST